MDIELCPAAFGRSDHAQGLHHGFDARILASWGKVSDAVCCCRTHCDLISTKGRAGSLAWVPANLYSGVSREAGRIYFDRTGWRSRLALQPMERVWR